MLVGMTVGSAMVAGAAVEEPLGARRAGCVDAVLSPLAFVSPAAELAAGDTSKEIGANAAEGNAAICSARVKPVVCANNAASSESATGVTQRGFPLPALVAEFAGATGDVTPVSLVAE
jgi:hypothetical protein